MFGDDQYAFLVQGLILLDLIVIFELGKHELLVFVIELDYLSLLICVQLYPLLIHHIAIFQSQEISQKSLLNNKRLFLVVPLILPMVLFTEPIIVTVK